jgi:hypothetical protein
MCLTVYKIELRSHTTGRSPGASIIRRDLPILAPVRRMAVRRGNLLLQAPYHKKLLNRHFADC